MAKPAKSERSSDKASNLPSSVAAVLGGDDSGRPSLWRALTPNILLDSTPAEWLFKLSVRRRHMLLLAVFCGLILFPYLGSVGFWDPWEPEYDEVAREMIWRHDFIYPFYELGSFFSKPVLSFWLMAIGQLIAGVNNPERGVALYTEWCVRSIFALCAIGGVLMTYQAVSRTISRRAAIWAGVIMITSPFYFLIARQTMVDIPYVAGNTAAIACLMIAVFEKDYVQEGWLYAFYALAGVVVLDKGLLGIALPGGAMLLYLIMSGDWRILTRLRLLTGPILTLIIFAPWYSAMFMFHGLDYEDQTSFWTRFIIHDHFQRLGYDPQAGQFVAGVHTTTPNTTFTYFLEQLGFGMFPWVALVPGGIAGFFAAAGLTRPRTRQERAKLFVIAWAVFTFLFFAYAATKFHHYALPIVPPLAIILGLYVEQILNEGVSKYALPLFIGLVFFGLVGQNLAMEPKHLTDLFVYNYDRPYPLHEVDQATIFTIGRWPISSQGVFGFMFGIAPLIAILGAPQVRRWMAAPDGSSLALVQERLDKAGRTALSGLVAIPRGLARAIAWVMRVLGVQKPVVEEPADRLFVVGTLAIMAFCFAVYTSAFHWRKLSVHWTQRDLIWEYHQLSKPTEPLGAYMMNWKGETFYTRNVVRQLKENNELREFVNGPGGRYWILSEEGRLGALKSTLGAGFDVKIIDKSNVKYALAVVSRAGSAESAPLSQ